MAEKIIVTTTIRLPDGLVLSDEQLAGIQSIVDNGSVIDPELPACEGNPTPMSVKVLSKKKLSVEWHGVKVSAVRWIIKNFSNGSVFDQGEITPTGGFLDVELSKELVAKQYKVVLEGVKCKGSGDPLTFDNTFFEDGGGENLPACKIAPRPEKVIVVSDKIWKIGWYGEGVEELKWSVYDNNNMYGFALVKPKSSDVGVLTVNLTTVPAPGINLTVALEGTSCSGGGALLFRTPEKSKEITIENISVSK